MVGNVVWRGKVDGGSFGVHFPEIGVVRHAVPGGDGGVGPAAEEDGAAA